MNMFFLDGVSSYSHGIILTKPPELVIPERDVTVISVPGRSGDLTIDSGRYKNTSIPYQCAIIPEDDQDLRIAAEAAMALLRPDAAYKRLESTYYPKTYQMARISRQVTVESIVEQAGKFTLMFDCKPQRYLKSGEHPITLTAPGTLRNPTNFEAQPLITVYGSGVGSLTVGERALALNLARGPIILDCEMQNAYSYQDNGTLVNRNADVYTPVFPMLPPGEFAVSWDGDLTGAEIIPRWWTL